MIVILKISLRSLTYISVSDWANMVM
jgi:hypothetical protein